MYREHNFHGPVHHGYNYNIRKYVPATKESMERQGQTYTLLKG